MRPLRLELEGFTCFREKQEALDFKNLHLFAIAGPTGAGKSSLLDAMIFALYGRVPRLKRNISELISLGRDRMAVTFDFRLAGKDYRISRIAYRNQRATKAQLERLREGEGVGMADGVRDVENELQELLGLDYETFIRAVVLPQGEFAAFLKSDASKRREILRRLLRLEVYRRMHKKAGEIKRSLQDRLDGEEHRLEEDYGDAKRAELVRLREEHQKLEKRLSKHSQAQAEREAKFAVLSRQREQTEAWEQKTAQLDALHSQAPEIERLREDLAASERALPLLPLFDRWRQARERVERAENEVQTQETIHQQTSEEATVVRAQLERARQASALVPDLRQRLQALDQISGLFEPRDKARLKVARHRREIREAETSIEAAGTRQAVLEKSLAPLRDAIDGLRDQIEKQGYDADLDAHLEASRDLAGTLRDDRRQAREAASEWQQLTITRKNLEEGVREALAKQEEAEKELERLVEQRETTEAELEHLRDHHRVVALRQELRVDEPCPVCEQPVRSLPEHLTTDTLNNAEVDVQSARQAVEAQRQVVQKASERAARARADERAAETRQKALQERSSELAILVATRTKELRRAVQGSAVQGSAVQGSAVQGSAVQEELDDSEGHLEDAVLSALHRLAEQRRVTGQLNQQLSKKDAEKRELEDQAEKTRQKRERATAKLSELRQALADLESELADYESRIRAVTQAEDPAEERRQLAEEIDRLQDAEQQAIDAEREKALALVTAKEKAEAARTYWKEAHALASELETEVEKHLLDADFKNEATAREATLTSEAQAAAAKRIRLHEEQRRDLERRVAELEKALVDKRISHEQIKTAKQSMEAGRAEEKSLVQAEGASTSALENLALRVERRTELQKKLEELRTRHRHHDELHTALRSDNFEAYLLEKVFRNLVVGASVRLLELSRQRYELTFSNDAFQVIDRDNANQTRSTDTLSGGETFLASLSLALELSEQVQREVGAVPLDSIFIDEGFGTLDPDTLDIVTEAIEALPDRGRTVGIITHVPELTRRLPFRIRVERRAGRSSYRIEEG